MKERALTLALAIAALVAFLVMFRGTAPGPTTAQLPRPTSVERAGSGLLALAEWLRRAGWQVGSWRESYERLGSVGPVGTGHLLVVALPGRVPIATAELAALERWVSAGNTLLVLAALADSPEWAAGEPPAFDVDALTGLEFVRRDGGRGTAAGAEQTPALRPLRTPRDHRARPNGTHPLLDGVRELQASSAAEPGEWVLRLPFATFALELARESGSGQGVLWLRPLGAGRIVLSGYGSLFANGVVARGDNARLFANLVGAWVKPGGAVLFDDGRQGLTADYDPARFYADARLHATVAIVVAFWLCWVLAGTRLRPLPAARRPPVPDTTQLLVRTAGFMERVLPRETAARQRIGAFARRIARRHGLPVATQLPWEWLTSRLGAGSTDLDELRRCCADLDAGRSVRLPRLHNLLLRLEARLT